MKPSVYTCAMCASDDCSNRQSKSLEVGEAAIIIEATGDVEHLKKILAAAEPLVVDHPKVIHANIQLDLRTKKTPLKKRRVGGAAIIAMGSIRGGDLPGDLPDEVKDLLRSVLGIGPDELETLDLEEKPDKEKEEARAEDWR